MSTPFFLEVLNGGLVTPDLIWLVLLGIYLSKESVRRELHWFDWFHLPASMNLMLAIFITDAAIVTRSWVVWVWRRFDGGGDFAMWHLVALIVTGFAVLAGTLCKIRAWTHPYYGNGPWLLACAVTVLGIIGLIIL